MNTSRLVSALLTRRGGVSVPANGAQHSARVLACSCRYLHVLSAGGASVSDRNVAVSSPPAPRGSRTRRRRAFSAHSPTPSSEDQHPDKRTSSKPLVSPEAYVSGAETHFGFKNVHVDEKEQMVKEVFAGVADSYDVMNDLMSGGIHRYWKDELLSMTSVQSLAKIIRQQAVDGANPNNTGRKFSILDVAGGTGDVAFRFVETFGCAERAKSSGRDEISITVCDINPDMLRVGEQRARDRFGNAIMDESQALSFVEGNAQSLPFDPESFDLYTIAFGLRNVTDVDAALRDAYRVLKPGGRYLCLEFSRVDNEVLRTLYDAYSFNVIPMVGELVAGDRASYQYLVESIRKFSDQRELAARLEAAGFENVTYTNMTGGIVAVHEGWKPI